jgi:hypothetical protein
MGGAQVGHEVTTDRNKEHPRLHLKWAVEMTVKCSDKETVGVRANTA